MIEIDADLKQKLDVFVAKGGKLLASGRSALSADGENPTFVYDFGVKYEQTAPITPCYVTPNEPIKQMGVADYVLYTAAECVSLTDGESFADLKLPYFARTTEHFCSHFHSPCAPQTVGVGASVGKNGCYIAPHIFYDYGTVGSQFVKQLVFKAIDLCLRDQKTLSVEFPSQGNVTLMEQTEQGRAILHLLYAPRIVKGANKVEVIEDCVPLYHVPVSLRLDRPVKTVYSAPDGEPISFTSKPDGTVAFEIPRTEIHTMIVLDYEK